jgi:23S rRNA pseudouridine2457 synthase
MSTTEPGDTDHKYFILHKPYNMVSQFVSSHNVTLLNSVNFKFPEGIHAIGRLDNNSEGLLILTTNKKVTRLLFKSAVPHKRTYLIKAKRKLTEESLDRLRTGVLIKIKSNEDYLAKVTEAVLITDYKRFDQPSIQDQYIDTTWLEVTLTEGKFHQVRKMIAAIGSKCIRLIRTSIEDLELGDLPPGSVAEIEETEFFRKLKIDNWKD